MPSLVDLERYSIRIENYSVQTLAITGAMGFLGRYLVSECLRQRRFNVRLLTRDRNVVDLPTNDSVAICQGNLLDPDSLLDFLSPDSTLIHLAYMNDSHDANIEAVYNLIGMVKRTGVKRVVHCSTAVVVGPGAKGVIAEEAMPDPRCEYQRTKLKLEEILCSELLPNVELAILRPTEIIGPGGKGLLSMIMKLHNAKPCMNFIHRCILKNRRFNYVSVYNVVEALIFLSALQLPQVGNVYNVSDDDDVDNNYAAVEDIICSSLDIKRAYPVELGLPRPVLSCLFGLLPNRSSPDRTFSCAKLTSLGYRKVITLRSAISALVSSIKNDL